MKKRVFTLLLLLAFALPGAAQAETPEAVEVPIIMYHKVTRDSGQRGKFAIAPEELEADLIFLQKSGYQAVTMQDLVDFVRGDGKLPPRPIVLTFDDGYFSDYHYVYPLARQYDTPVVLSIIGKVTDEYTQEGRQDIIYPHLTWPQVEEMAGSGLVEIQNHGYDLHCTRAGCSGAKRRHGESRDAYAERLGGDLTKLQTRLSARLGQAPATFTYPFGAKSEGSDDILKNLGFQASLMATGRRNLVMRGEPDGLFSMGRIIRPHGRSLEQILASCP